MSVILYTRDEIVSAIAASWNRGSIGSTDNLRYMDYLAEAGNRIMQANCEAYNATYTNDPEPAIAEEPITQRSIKGALIRQTMDSKSRGLRCLDGLHYNLIANNGQDFATAEILDDLLGMVTAVIRKSRELQAA